MDREDARQKIRARVDCGKYLEKSRSGIYCCPYCDSGNGKHATGALKLYKTNTWTCHACVKSGDVIDLYQQEPGVDYNTALSLLADEIGITIDLYRPDVAIDFREAPPGRIERTERPQRREKEKGNTPVAEKTLTDGAEMTTSTLSDYTAYYTECRKRLNDLAAVAYLNSRGISVETAAYWIGYDPKADPAQSNHPCPQLIISTRRIM